MKKILDKFQGQFGAIKKDKVFVYIIIGAFWVMIVAATWWGLTVSDGVLRPMIILVAIAATVSLIVMVTRNPRRKVIKIPVNPKNLEKYVAVDRTATAEIPLVPISAERQYTHGVRQAPQPVRSPTQPHELPSVELSAFALKRIAEENNIHVTHGTFEIRKTAKSLFIQYPKRIPFVKKEVQRKDRKTGKMVDVRIMKRPPPSTIYRELLLMLVSLGVLLLPALLGIATLTDWVPDWAIALSVAFNSSQIAPLIVLVAGCISMLYAIGMFYKKWAYWRFWRAVLLPPGPQTSRHGFLVVIDMPPFLGGGAPLIDLKRVNRCYIATGVSERDEKGFGGLVMKILRIRWMIVDIPGDKDSDVNLMGPLKLRDAAPASQIIKGLSASANTRDNE